MSSWSYSAYSMAAQCLRKHKYAFVDKIVPEGPEGGDLVFGSALHSALNGALTGLDGQAMFRLYWSSYANKEIEYGSYGWKELASLGDGFIRKFVKYHADRYRLDFAEKRLYAEYKGVKLEGQPDFYGSYKERASLRDFKTSGRNYEPERSACATQLYLYAFLCKENGIAPKLDTLGYTVFNKGTGSIQDLTWEFKERKMLETLDELVSYVKIWESSSEKPMNFGSCLDYNRRCQYYALCHKEK